MLGIVFAEPLVELFAGAFANVPGKIELTVFLTRIMLPFLTFVAVAAACNEWSEAPSVHLQGEFDGLLDTVTILDETLDDLPDDRRQLRPLRQRLRDRIEGVQRAVETVTGLPTLHREVQALRDKLAELEKKLEEHK